MYTNISFGGEQAMYKKRKWYIIVSLSVSSSREQEVQSLSGPDEFREFYRRLRRIQEYHSE